MNEASLIIAVKEGKVQAVKCLVSKGADPASRKYFGWNSLHSAIPRGNKDSIDTILFRGVDIESKTKSGETPLMMARHLGLTGTVSYLLNNGAKSD